LYPVFLCRTMLHIHSNTRMHIRYEIAYVCACIGADFWEQCVQLHLPLKETGSVV